jgi:hypothetical protein
MFPRLDGLPPWTYRYALPASLSGVMSADSACRAIGHLWDRVSAAGFPDRAILGGVPGGIFIVCSPEHIDSHTGRRTGTPFSLDPTPTSRWRFWEVFEGIFSPHVDRYRILVLAIGLDRLDGGAATTSADSVRALLRRGITTFRESTCRLDSDTPSCEAIVFEFKRAGPHDSLSFVPQSQISLPDHLRGTGLWSKEELRGVGL